jgi:hypothetical protein
MLLNGGARPDLDLFLVALSCHQYRRYSGPRTRSEAAIRARGVGEADGLYQLLSEGWPKDKPEKSPDVTEPRNSVAEIARKRICDAVREHFEDFLASTEGIEATWFLNEVLEYVNANSVDIVEGFMRVVENDYTYVRVPWEMKALHRDKRKIYP